MCTCCWRFCYSTGTFFSVYSSWWRLARLTIDCFPRPCLAESLVVQGTHALLGCSKMCIHLQRRCSQASLERFIFGDTRNQNLYYWQRSDNWLRMYQRSIIWHSASRRKS